jgi:hypothetical protein
MKQSATTAQKNVEKSCQSKIAVRAFKKPNRPAAGPPAGWPV